jgi:hypothetical protein
VTQASTTHRALHAIARETDTYPIGRKKINAAGLKMKATTRKATIVVYPVPVDFWDVLNITNLLGCWMA